MSYIRRNFTQISKCENDPYPFDLNCDICKVDLDSLGVYYYMNFEDSVDNLCADCMKKDLQWCLERVKC